MVSESG